MLHPNFDIQPMGYKRNFGSRKDPKSPNEQRIRSAAANPMTLSAVILSLLTLHILMRLLWMDLKWLDCFSAPDR